MIPYIFVLCAEILASMIRGNKNINGISINRINETVDISTKIDRSGDKASVPYVKRCKEGSFFWPGVWHVYNVRSYDLDMVPNIDLTRVNCAPNLIRIIQFVCSWKAWTIALYNEVHCIKSNCSSSRLLQLRKQCNILEHALPFPGWCDADCRSTSDHDSQLKKYITAVGGVFHLRSLGPWFSLFLRLYCDRTSRQTVC